MCISQFSTCDCCSFPQREQLAIEGVGEVKWSAVSDALNCQYSAKQCAPKVISYILPLAILYSVYDFQSPTRLGKSDNRPYTVTWKMSKM